MTVPVQTPRQQYTADGIDTTYDADWLLKQWEHLLVWVQVSGATSASLQTLYRDYWITGGQLDEDGKLDTTQVTTNFAEAPASGATVSLIRSTPCSQETDFTSNVAFLMEAYELALDKLTMIFQELAAALGQLFVQAPPSTNGPDQFRTVGRSMIYRIDVNNGDGTYAIEEIEWDSVTRQWDKVSGGREISNARPFNACSTLDPDDILAGRAWAFQTSGGADRWRFQIPRQCGTPPAARDPQRPRFGNIRLMRRCYDDNGRPTSDPPDQATADATAQLWAGIAEMDEDDVQKDPVTGLCWIGTQWISTVGGDRVVRSGTWTSATSCGSCTNFQLSRCFDNADSEVIPAEPTIGENTVEIPFDTMPVIQLQEVGEGNITCHYFKEITQSAVTQTNVVGFRASCLDCGCPQDIDDDGIPDGLASTYTVGAAEISGADCSLPAAGTPLWSRILYIRDTHIGGVARARCIYQSLNTEETTTALGPNHRFARAILQATGEQVIGGTRRRVWLLTILTAFDPNPLIFASYEKVVSTVGNDASPIGTYTLVDEVGCSGSTATLSSGFPPNIEVEA